MCDHGIRRLAGGPCLRSCLVGDPLMRGGARAGRGSRVCAGRVPECRARTLAPAVVEGRRHRDHRDSCQERQQQRGPLQGQAPGHPACGPACFIAARVPPLAARTPDRPARASPDPLALRHLLARCQPGEPRQQRCKTGIGIGEPVRNRIQGLLLSRAAAHRWSLPRLAMSRSAEAPGRNRRSLAAPSCVQWSAKRTRWRCSWRGSYRCPGSRNGCRRRERDTRAGTIELAIPKLRAGSCFPSFASTAAGPGGRWPRSWRPATCWAS